MARSPLGLDDLPDEFAVFPLTGALLLPGNKLPLNIFEPRYLAMVEDALAAPGRHFGMIQPDAARPPGPTGPALYRVGCLGRLSTFAETEDGRYLITLTGVCRYAVEQELPMQRGYRRVRADLSSFAADLDAAPAPQRPVLDREQLTGALRAYFAARSFDANWDAIGAMPDDVLVSTLSMVCPFQPAEKQALLEASTQADRARALLALLWMGPHEGTAGSAGSGALS